MKSGFLLVVLFLGYIIEVEAGLVRVNVNGTISRISGDNNLLNNSVFNVGDSVTYQVEFDEGNFGSDFNPGRNNIGNFRANIGGYLLSGNGGTTFTRIDGNAGTFDEPFDQFSITHANSTFNEATTGGAVTTSDFISTGGDVGGFPPSTLSITFQNPEVNFIDQGDSIENILQNISDNLALIGQPTTDGRTNTQLFSLDFNDEAFGLIDLGIDINIDSLELDAPLVESPLAFGTASAAAVTARFMNSVAIFNDSVDDFGGINSFSNAFITSGGNATARGEITEVVIDEQELTVPGLEVGAFTSTNGGTNGARGIAFRSFDFLGEESTNININSVLDGEFNRPSSGLPIGRLGVEGGVYVFDAIEFADAIDFLGGDLDQIFFPFRGGTFSDFIDGRDIRELSIPRLLGINPLSSSVFDIQPNFNRTIEEMLDLNFTAESGRQFTVLYDIQSFAESFNVNGRTAGGSVNFFNSLSSADTFFTDDSGNEITNIRAVLGEEQASTEVPEPSTFAFFLLLIGYSMTQKRKRSSHQ